MSGDVTSLIVPMLSFHSVCLCSSSEGILQIRILAMRMAGNISYHDEALWFQKKYIYYFYLWRESIEYALDLKDATVHMEFVLQIKSDHYGEGIAFVPL